MNNKFQGTGVAIVTPFLNGEVDYNGFEKMINHVITGGVNFIVVLGSTGEGATVDDLEARQLLDFAIQTIDGHVPLVAGNFGGNSTRALVKKIEAYNFDGIDAILSSSPSYNKPSQEGIYQHYTAMADATDTPIILYNVPSRTASNIIGETTLRLANHENIIGIKEASGDIIQCREIIRNQPDNFFLTSGDDMLAPAIIQAGGIGVISVIANVLPDYFSSMVKAYIENDIEKAKSIEAKINDLHYWLYAEGNPCGVKTALEILGICSASVRLPLTKVSRDVYNEIVKILKLLKA